MQYSVDFGNSTYLVLSEIMTVEASTKYLNSRQISKFKSADTTIDFTAGKKCRAVIRLKNGFMVLSSLTPQTIVKRMEYAAGNIGDKPTEEVKQEERSKKKPQKPKTSSNAKIR